MSFLYRALRPLEIEKGYILIPKSNESFLACEKFPMPFPIPFGQTEIGAIKDHQFNGKYPTRGVSTTFDKKIALSKYCPDNGVVAIICRVTCAKIGIKEYIVKDHLAVSDILHPEDEEVILVLEKNGAFPKERINIYIRSILISIIQNHKIGTHQKCQCFKSP